MNDNALPPEQADSNVEQIILTVAEDEAGLRLDKLLASRLAHQSRSALQKWIVDGRVTIDGAPAKASLRVAPGQMILVRPPLPVDQELLPEPIPLNVVYEDEFLAVIDKPAGMVVHPAAGHASGTLVNALLARYPELSETTMIDASGEPPRPGIVHRLDKDTSGLIVVAKTAGVREGLQAQFGTRAVEKTYQALVHDVPSTPEGEINAPIGRDPRQRKRMAVVKDGRPAQTEYRVLEIFGQYALLAVSPKTGRTHQIRVHMAFIGHPVVGDRVYGRRRQGITCPRQFLHAGRIAFTHPVLGEQMEFSAPLPDDLAAVLQSLADDRS